MNKLLALVFAASILSGCSDNQVDVVNYSESYHAKCGYGQEVPTPPSVTDEGYVHSISDFILMECNS